MAGAGQTQAGAVRKKARRWTDEEHQRLEYLVQRAGPRFRWTDIAIALNTGHNGKQVREHYLNARPDSKKGGWTYEEERLFAKLHARLGPAWSRISRHLENRTETDTKNHFNSLTRCKTIDFRTSSLLAVYVKLIREGAEPSIGTYEEALRQFHQYNSDRSPSPTLCSYPSQPHTLSPSPTSTPDREDSQLEDMLHAAVAEIVQQHQLDQQQDIGVDATTQHSPNEPQDMPRLIEQEQLPYVTGVQPQFAQQMMIHQQLPGGSTAADVQQLMMQEQVLPEARCIETQVVQQQLPSHKAQALQQVIVKQQQQPDAVSMEPQAVQRMLMLQQLPDTDARTSSQVVQGTMVAQQVKGVEVAEGYSIQQVASGQHADTCHMQQMVTVPPAASQPPFDASHFIEQPVFTMRQQQQPVMHMAGPAQEQTGLRWSVGTSTGVAAAPVHPHAPLELPCCHKAAHRSSLEAVSRSWTSEEEAVLARLHADLGPAWSWISNKLDGRTPEDVERHWGRILTEAAACQGVAGSLLHAYAQLLVKGSPACPATLERAVRHCAIHTGVEQGTCIAGRRSVTDVACSDGATVAYHMGPSCTASASHGFFYSPGDAPPALSTSSHTLYKSDVVAGHTMGKCDMTGHIMHRQHVESATQATQRQRGYDQELEHATVKARGSAMVRLSGSISSRSSFGAAWSNPSGPSSALGQSPAQSCASVHNPCTMDTPCSLQPAVDPFWRSTYLTCQESRSPFAAAHKPGSWHGTDVRASASQFETDSRDRYSTVSGMSSKAGVMLPEPAQHGSGAGIWTVSRVSQSGNGRPNGSGTAPDFWIEGQGSSSHVVLQEPWHFSMGDLPSGVRNAAMKRCFSSMMESCHHNDTPPAMPGSTMAQAAGISSFISQCISTGSHGRTSTNPSSVYGFSNVVGARGPCSNARAGPLSSSSTAIMASCMQAGACCGQEPCGQAMGQLQEACMARAPARATNMAFISGEDTDAPQPMCSNDAQCDLQQLFDDLQKGHMDLPH